MGRDRLISGDLGPGARTNAGEHQDLRGLHRAGAQQHFAARRETSFGVARRVRVLDAAGAKVALTSLQGDTCHVRARGDAQVGPPLGALQVGVVGRAPLAIVLRHLEPAEAVLGSRPVVKVDCAQIMQARLHDVRAEAAQRRRPQPAESGVVIGAAVLAQPRQPRVRCGAAYGYDGSRDCRQRSRRPTRAH